MLPWDKNAYEEQCYRLADDYVSSATRFGKVDLNKVRADSAIRIIKVKLSCKRSTVLNKQDIKGEIDAEVNDLVTDDGDLFELVIKKMFDDEAKSLKLSELFLGELEQQNYGAFREKHLFRTHPNRAVLKQLCSACNGCGSKKCSSCGGKGISVCSVCHGSIQQTCNTCHGHCNVGSQQRCPSCNGSGKIGCRSCGGVGSIRCMNCSGTGRFVCATCEGKKYLSKICTVDTFFEPSYTGVFSDDDPDYVSSTCLKIGIENIGSYLHRWTLASKEFSGDSVEMDYLIAVPFCELVVQFREDQFALIFAGETPELFDAGGVIEKLVAEDVCELESHNLNSRWFSPSSVKKGAALVSTLSESEVIQNLLELSKKGGSFEYLSDGLNNALSSDFVARVLLAVNKPLEASSNKNRMIFLLIGTLTAAPISSIFVLNKYFSDPHPFGKFHEGTFEPYFFALVICSMLYGLFVGVFGVFSSRFLVRQYGHKSVAQYAKSFSLLLGYKFALGSALVCSIATFSLASLFPVKSEVFGRLYVEFGSSNLEHRVYLPNRSARIMNVPSPDSVEELKGWFRSLCSGNLETSPEYVESILLKFEKSNFDKYAISNAINCLPKSASNYLPSFEKILNEGDRAYVKENKRLVAIDDKVRSKIIGTWMSTSCNNVNGSQDSQCGQYAGLRVRYNSSEAETTLGSGVSQKSSFSLNDINVIDGNLLVIPKSGSTWKYISEDRMILRFKNLEFSMRRV